MLKNLYIVIASSLILVACGSEEQYDTDSDSIDNPQNEENKQNQKAKDLDAVTVQWDASEQFEFSATDYENRFTIDISKESIDLTFEFGKQKISFPWVEPILINNMMQFSSFTEKDSTEINIIITKDTCFVIEHHIYYPKSVQVAYLEHTFRGCGGDTIPRKIMEPTEDVDSTENPLQIEINN